ncbi:MAG TPA: hypothetical protein VGH54_29500 [Mycobacterium sp.]|uniref:hypothetical protein n=1 Tax=Mycobacterium sp. TaxID=1785 RepID=UPI002F40497F
MSGDEDEALRVESTRDPDGEPACLFTWGAFQWYAPVAEVRKAALDMVACAAYAEMMMTLVAKLKLDGGIASALITDLLKGRGVKEFGTPGTLDLLPAGSTRSGDAVVLLRRGSKREPVAAVTARSMALQWLEAAEATESDQLVSEAMRGTGISRAQQERLFGYLRELRKEPS